jgi:glutamate carboxypeptidase
MSAPLDLLRYFDAHLEEDLLLLKRLVEMESCSRDKNGIDLLAEFLAGEFTLLGAEILPLTGSGNALRVVWPGKGFGKPILLLGHLDTVWPAGTIRERPFVLKEGRAYGPGILDMKSGVLLCLLICRALHKGLLSSDREVRIFFTPDEEIGSRSGLPLLEPIARTCGAVLCLEPPLSGGRAKTSRKGVGTFRLRIAGIAAHAGVEPEKGASAILEMSHQIVKLHQMTSRERGCSVCVGIVQGGSAGNVVPSHAEAEIDFRFATLAEGQRLEKRIRKLRPKDPRCGFEIEGGVNRPPLERTPAVTDLFLKAKMLAAQIGMDLGEGETGGGSDGSFTAALGIPTLDGLGVEGDGAHAVHEHILVGDVPRRAALIGLLAQEVMK